MLEGEGHADSLCRMDLFFSTANYKPSRLRGDNPCDRLPQLPAIQICRSVGHFRLACVRKIVSRIRTRTIPIVPRNSHKSSKSKKKGEDRDSADHPRGEAARRVPGIQTAFEIHGLIRSFWHLGQRGPAWAPHFELVRHLRWIGRQNQGAGCPLPQIVGWLGW